MGTVLLDPRLGREGNVRGGVADLHGGVRAGRGWVYEVLTVLLLIGLGVCVVKRLLVVVFATREQASFSPRNPAEFPRYEERYAKEGKTTGSDHEGQQAHRDICKETKIQGQFDCASHIYPLHGAGRMTLTHSFLRSCLQEARLGDIPGSPDSGPATVKTEI